MVTDVHLALVHKIQQRLHLRVVHVLEEDDRMGVFVLQEDVLKIGTAGGQNCLVGLEGLADARQGDIAKGLARQQRAQHVG